MRYSIGYDLAFFFLAIIIYQYFALLQEADNNPPTTSRSGKPICYSATSNHPHIGRNAPTLADVASGRLKRKAIAIKKPKQKRAKEPSIAQAQVYILHLVFMLIMRIPNLTFIGYQPRWNRQERQPRLFRCTLFRCRQIPHQPFRRSRFIQKDRQQHHLPNI